MKPFSTYPEDRQKLLDLCKQVEMRHFDQTPDALTLADLVRAILEDEQFVIDEGNIA